MTRSFLLQASIVVFFLAGSSAPTPLYPIYQAAWGLSPVTVTAIFAIYAMAVLVTLLLVGSLSDFVGRRPVLLVTAVLQAVSMGLFVGAHGVGALIAARVIQGFATGAAVGAAGAGMIDVERDRGTLVNGIAPMLGTGTGSVVSGLCVEFLPAPTKLIYLVLGAIFIAQTIGVAAMPESVTRRAGALASLRPRLHVPQRLRRPVMVVVPALVGAWALVGFYGSLGPSLVRRLMASSAPAIGGLALFVLAGGGVAAVLASRRTAPLRTMQLGTAALAFGVAVTLHAVGATSVVEFFVGTAIAGAGFGASFHGAVRSVMGLAAPHERAAILSVLYVVCYLAMGLPAVVGGLLVVHGGGLLATAREYGIAVIMLAGAAMTGTLFPLAKAQTLAASPVPRSPVC
jgi:predicted MFS family arabinose efflux permease